MNVGEHGIAYHFNANFNLSAHTSLVLEFTRPDKTVVAHTSPDVAAPNVPHVCEETQFGTFAANQYARYLIQPGDLTIPGVYTARLTYIDGTKLIKSDIGEAASFTVNA